MKPVLRCGRMVSALICFASSPDAFWAAAPEATRVELTADVAYAGTSNPAQTLDIYLPKERVPGWRLPVIVFLHGGGWVGGSKAAGQGVLQPYVESGMYAGVSVEYRLAGEAPWPAMMHDCKAGIRWIRANARPYGFEAAKIGVLGGSAGGTLATLLGVGGGVPELEGVLGPHLQESSRVTCVVNRFGRMNFLAEPESARAAPNQAKALAGRLRQLFGGTLEEKTSLARLASPVNHITPDDPPILTVHGTADAVVPFVQAEELAAAMRRVGRPHLLLPMQGFGHGLKSAEEDRRVRQFFDLHLRGIPAEISLEPIVAPATKKKARKD